MEIEQYDEVDMGVDPNLKMPEEPDIDLENKVKSNEALDR